MIRIQQTFGTMHRTSLLLSFIIGVFGISSWITINGLWVQLPLLVQRLPEGWNLPSYLIIVSQIANVGPLLYILLQRCVDNKSALERIAIYLILIIGCVSTLLLTQFWHITFSTQHSIVFLGLALLMSSVDCSTSVTFLPYMVQFAPPYVTALYVGEGFSGLLPGVMGLIQGIGGEAICNNQSILINDSLEFAVIPTYPPPLFSVSEFMWFLCSMLTVSLVAFMVLDKSRWIRPYRMHAIEQTQSFNKHSPLLSSDRRGEMYYRQSNHDAEMLEGLLHSDVDQHPAASQHSNWGFYLAVMWMAFLCNGFLPSLQSYTSLSYSVLVYHLVATLTNIVNPLACFCTFFVVPVRRSAAIVAMLIGITVVAGYVLLLALSSPTPPLYTSAWGGFLSVAAWVVLVGLVSYLKTSIAILLRPMGQTALVYYGVATQVGSLFGAITSFLMVNVFNLFVSKPPC